MEDKWTVRSYGKKDTKWESLDQIEGNQTLLLNNLFGITLRIVPTGDDKYKIIDFGITPINIYNRLMEENGMDTERAYEEIKRELLSGEWTATNLQGLMDYGVVEGISTRLQLKDQENHFETDTRGEFLKNPDLETMRKIEWDEYFNYEATRNMEITDEEKLELLERFMGDEPEASTKLMYEKYKGIVEEKRKSKEYGARTILEFMEKHNLTNQDLSLALAMAQATKTGVRKVEGHIIDEKESQITHERGEDTQIG